MKLLIHANELVTCSGFGPKRGEEMRELALIKDGAVLIEGDTIAKVGTTDELAGRYKDAEIIDCSGKAVLPGFVDSHTHLVFGGYRPDEFSWRLNGISYMEIMKRGGGINATTKPTREASKEELYSLGMKRLDSILSFGVTTVEANDPQIWLPAQQPVQFRR
jgi:imidazolonepropionase